MLPLFINDVKRKFTVENAQISEKAPAEKSADTFSYGE